MLNEFLSARILYLSDEMKDYATLTSQNCRFIEIYAKLKGIKLPKKTSERLKESLMGFNEIRSNIREISNKLKEANEDYVNAANALLKKNTDLFTHRCLRLISFLVKLSEDRSFGEINGYINHVILEEKIFLEKVYSFY